MTAPHLRWLLLALFAMLPLLPLGVRALSVEGLGPDPGQVLIRFLGLTSLQFLCATLAITPLRRITGYGALVSYRRGVGLLCLAYAVLHVTAYLMFSLGMRWQQLPEEVIERPFILLGMIALAILLVMGITSNDWAIRRLRHNWKRLHRLVYLAALLVCAHFVLQVRSDLERPLVYSALVLLLLGYRAYHSSFMKLLIAKRS